MIFDDSAYIRVPIRIDVASSSTINEAQNITISS
jgi:hypothetical protein